MPDDVTLSNEAEMALQQHDWPGNVRELENVIKRASLLAKAGNIEVRDLGLPQSNNPVVAPIITQEPDKDILVETLNRNKRNISQTARELGLSRQSLYRRMDKFGIPR